MKKLLQEVEQGKWNGVLVMEIERLARGDTIDQGIVAQAFKYSETKIITPSKIYDPSNEYDEEYFEFGLFMSRREFKTINRRIQRGRIASVKEGKYISSTPPYGYLRQKLSNEKGYTLIPYEEQAKVVKLIYEWYIIGYPHVNGTLETLGCMKIAKLLNSLKYKPPRANNWSKSTVLDILKNPVYMGYIRWQHRKEVTNLIDNHTKKSHRYTSDSLLVKGIHKPIIEEQLFQRVQKQLKNRNNHPIPSNRTLSNPLLELIFCSKCGKPLTRLAKSKKCPYDLLKCMNTDCNNISTPLFLVEEIIIIELSKWAQGYNYEPSLIDVLSPLSSLICKKETYLKEINLQKNRKEKNYEKICEYLEEGVYSPEDFTTRKIKILKDLKELNELHITLDKELTQLKIKYQDNITLPRIQSLSSLYYSILTTRSKNDFLKNLIERIDYRKDQKNGKGEVLQCNFTLDIYPKISKIL